MSVPSTASMNRVIPWIPYWLKSFVIPKINNFFRDREIIKLLWSKFQDRELLGSRIIRHVRIRTRTYTCAQVQPRFVSRATTTLWSRRSRRKRLNRQSRLHCLPDKFRHLGHGPRCDSDGLGPERRPNGSQTARR